MDEPIYCPKCEGTQHKHNLYNLRGHHPMVHAAQFLMNISVTHIFGLRFIRHHTPDETYIPESYYCQTCGNCFLSSNTYAEEIRNSKDFRKKSLWRGLFCLAFAALLAAYLIAYYCIGFASTDVIYAYILLSIFLILSCIFGGSIFFSAKEAKKTLEEWKQFQDVQAKHTKTINDNSKEYIPTWKRVQTEDQNQGSL